MPGSDSPARLDATAPRGFVYFCEERRQFYRGMRAWIFWAPYLAGIVLLEPSVSGAAKEGLGTWLPLLAFLVIFPPLWRRLMRVFPAWQNQSLTKSD